MDKFGMKYARSTLEKISKVLDEMAEGGSYAKIAKRAGTSASFAFNLAQDFPLWLWAKEHAEDQE